MSDIYVHPIRSIHTDKGMTLRDYFAGQALAGILAGGFADTIPHDDVGGGRDAAACVSIRRRHAEGAPDMSNAYHRWFAWHPVRTEDWGWRWLCFVYRRRITSTIIFSRPTPASGPTTPSRRRRSSDAAIVIFWRWM